MSEESSRNTINSTYSDIPSTDSDCFFGAAPTIRSLRLMKPRSLSRASMSSSEGDLQPVFPIGFSMPVSDPCAKFMQPGRAPFASAGFVQQQPPAFAAMPTLAAMPARPCGGDPVISSNDATRNSEPPLRATLAFECPGHGVMSDFRGPSSRQDAGITSTVPAACADLSAPADPMSATQHLFHDYIEPAKIKGEPSLQHDVGFASTMPGAHADLRAPAHLISTAQSRFYNYGEPSKPERDCNPVAEHVADVPDSSCTEQPMTTKLVQPSFNSTLLMQAARESRALLAARADVSSVDPHTDFTPLMSAARDGNRQMVLELMRLGADPRFANSSGSTAVMSAAVHGHLEILIDLLAANADPGRCDRFGQTALMRAAQGGHTSCLRALLKVNADPKPTDNDGGYSALMWAARDGHEEAVAELLMANACPSTQARFGETPLILAARNGHTGAARQLLAATADPSRTDRSGRNALMLASQKGHFGLVLELLGARVDVAPATRGGETALILAAQNGRCDVLQALLACRASPADADSSGSTALVWAARRGLKDVIAALLAAGGHDAQKCQPAFAQAKDAETRQLLSIVAGARHRAHSRRRRSNRGSGGIGGAKQAATRQAAAAAVPVGAPGKLGGRR